MNFIIRKYADNLYRWELKVDGRSAIKRGDGYISRSECVKGIQVFKDMIRQAAINEDVDGKLRLVHAKG